VPPKVDLVVTNRKLEGRTWKNLEEPGRTWKNLEEPGRTIELNRIEIKRCSEAP